MAAKWSHTLGRYVERDDAPDDGPLSVRIEDLEVEVADYPLEQIRDLIAQEHAGRNRKGALDVLERLAAAKADQQGG